MSTVPHQDHEPHDASGQSLLFAMGIPTVLVTGLFALAATQLGVNAALLVAYGGLLVAAILVFAFILRFIGPEDHDE